MLKKSMIMAAGVGSRLGILSDVLPKPLVPLVNKAAMDLIINHLYSFGIEKFIANTYYKAECIENHYKDNKDIFLNREKELSGTAGGVKKCQNFFTHNEDFIVMSADGLCDIDVSKLYDSHIKSGAIATIVLKEVSIEKIPMYGIVVPDEHNFVNSFQEKPEAKDAKSNLANTGIYIFNYRIFDYIPENEFYDFAKNVFPSMLAKGEKINTYLHNGYWSDIGSIDQYKESHFDILNKKIDNYQPEIYKTEFGQYAKGKGFQIDESSVIYGNCSFGNNCVIGKNVKIINSILWDNVTVKEGTVIDNSIILSGATISGGVKNTIISAKEESISIGAK